MPETSNSSLPYPSLGLVPNVPADIQALAQALDVKVSPAFSSAAIRDATITAPGDGQLAFLQDSHTPCYYHAGIGGYTTLGYVLLDRRTLAVDTSSVSFTSIPSAFSSLRVIGSCRSTGAVIVDPILWRLNSDSSTAYEHFRNIYDSAGTPGQTIQGSVGVASSAGICALVSGASTGAAGGGVFTMDIPYYSSTTWNKHMISTSACPGYPRGDFGGMWNSNAAVNRVQIFAQGGNLKAGSSFSLYAIG